MRRSPQWVFPSTPPSFFTSGKEIDIDTRGNQPYVHSRLLLSHNRQEAATKKDRKSMDVTPPPLPWLTTDATACLASIKPFSCRNSILPGGIARVTRPRFTALGILQWARGGSRQRPAATTTWEVLSQVGNRREVGCAAALLQRLCRLGPYSPRRRGNRGPEIHHSIRIFQLVCVVFSFFLRPNKHYSQ